MTKRSKPSKRTNAARPPRPSLDVPQSNPQHVGETANPVEPSQTTDSQRPDLSNVSVYIDGACAPPELVRTRPSILPGIEKMYEAIAGNMTGSFQPTTYEEASESFAEEQANLKAGGSNVNQWVVVQFLQFEGDVEGAHLIMHAVERILPVRRGDIIACRALDIHPNFFVDGAYPQSSGYFLLGSSGPIKAKTIMTYWSNTSCDAPTPKRH